MQVAYLGEIGAYSEEAAVEYFGADARLIPQDSFYNIFRSVQENKVDFGLVPIENSLAGSIHQNYDLLLQHNLSIVGEQYLRIHHCLIGRPGAQISNIKKIISHPQALAQCERYIRNLPSVSPEPKYNTAGSVKMISKSSDNTVAAIASKRAAHVYGMEILEEGIEDNSANYTRFIALALEPVEPKNNAKTSIVFSLNNEPGALFKALSVFALRDIDMTKIESRPQVGKVWEYLFYIDFIGSILDKPVERALEHLKEYALMLRVLGSYPKNKFDYSG
jgi:prephenate dehydratase